MKHMDDRRRCPHCGKDSNERPYMMARNAPENVLSARAITWIVAIVLLFVVASIAANL